MPKTGKLQINANGDTAIAICSSKYCACKTVSETRVTVQKEDCEIDEETGEIGTKKETNPVGTVISYMGSVTPPDGYLSCDGSIYNISEYPKLAEQFKAGLGSYNYYGGDGTTTFAVPDLRGEFLRGTGTNGHTNNVLNVKEGSGSDVGKHQNSTVMASGVWGTGNSTTENRIFQYGGNRNWIVKNQEASKSSSGASGRTSYTSTQRITENYQGIESYSARPTNTSVLYCIKY